MLQKYNFLDFCPKKLTAYIFGYASGEVSKATVNHPFENGPAPKRQCILLLRVPGLRWLYGVCVMKISSGR